MRVLLFFPPQCRPLHPHLGLPLIKSELQRRGHECRVVDLNIRFYDYVLRSETLRTIAERIRPRVLQMDATSVLTDSEAVQFLRMATALMRSRYVIDHVDEAVAIFRSEQFYDYGRFLWARKVVEDALDLYGSAYGNTDIGLSQLRMPYGTASTADIWQATEDRQQNCFVDSLSEWADEEISDFNPDVIGMSIALDEQLIPAFTLARHLRRTWDGVLVAGGSMITRLRDDLPNDPVLGGVFDHVFAYESECEFGTLVDSMQTDTRDWVPLGSKGSIVAERNKLFTELRPDFDDLPLGQYLLPDLILPFLGSRGCSWGRCRYCSHYKTYGRFVFGDPARAAGHVKILSDRYNCRHFYFVDEALEPKFGTAFAEALEDLGADIRWMEFARIHKGWSAEIIKKVAAAGCRRLIFGLDSATDRIQDLMDKHTDLQHAKHVLQWSAEAGIAAQVNFITGFPGEVESEARETVNFVKDNREALLTLGSTVAFSNFMLVREAGWEHLAVEPVVDPNKRFALYYAYRNTTDGLTMRETPSLAYELQIAADDELGSSSRFPLLREFAFLYRDHYGPHTTPPKSTDAPSPELDVHWFQHDLHRLFKDLMQARETLAEVPNEYLSVWSRIASETQLTSVATQELHGYRVGARFDNNSFDLPIIDAFVWRTNEPAVGALT